jgi:hypothetical protein
MAPQYNLGDVVFFYFPNDNPKTKDAEPNTLRRVLIVEVLSHEEYSVACITKHKYHVGINRGYWVEANSDTGKKMRLDVDSFINLDDIKPLKWYYMRNKIGYCDIIDQILEDLGLS